MTNDPSDETDSGPAHRHASRPVLVVGIGASAGGIEALRHFFAHVPPTSGIAYVVILHLAPDFESHLAEVLQATAAIPVTQVTDEVPLEADHVYVISPNQTLEAIGHRLHVAPMTRQEERRSPVDTFFRTLAEAYGTGAVAVVLSGTGPNGSSGLKRVNELGGLTIVQDPAESEFPGMPTNSINTGLVDHVLPVAQIPARIIDYARRMMAMPLQPLLEPAVMDPERSSHEVAIEQVRAAQEWRDVLALLRVRTGQDFSNYKTTTIRRRVERRLNVRGLSTLTEYADLLRVDPNEPQMLMKDLLISVTNFFRDPAAFAALQERVVPLLFERNGSGDQVRAWSAGCATGEEAYTLAMLLAEHAATLVNPPSIQVFATDLDEQAISVAREGLYSDADVADISPDRLTRFFQCETGGYRVRRELRELVLFAHHNVLKDPPFSHLDLIACRNLLIYLTRPAQEWLIETFHFALRPAGYLFLGTSETADADDDLFMVFDNNAHVFESRTVLSRSARPLTAGRLPPMTPSFQRPPGRQPQAERISPGELHLRLLEQYAPPSLVVNEEHTLLHASEKAGEFLQMPGGEPSREILRLIHPDLRADLRTGLHLAAQERAPIEIRGVRAQLAGRDRVVRIVVRPVLREDSPPRGYFLVLFEDDAEPARTDSERAIVQFTSPAEPEAHQLSDELSRTKGQLRATLEQYETHAEEAHAANEELQAMNEELRSAAEELETSKEELQSLNQELKIKIEELGLTNNDFQNLINSTDIATIFLDRSLRVKLSTPRARDLFNLLPTDVRRKLSDITTKLLYEPLHEETAQVLDRLQTVEREVQTREGRWYLMRLGPYRTTDDRIDGVVLTFHDITPRRTAETQLRANEERLRVLIDSVVDYAIFTVTVDGRIETWNAGAERMFGYTAGEITGQDIAILFTAEDRAARVPQTDLAQAYKRGSVNDERWHVRKDGSRLYCSGVTTRIDGSNSLAKVERDVTDRRRAEVALEDEHHTLEQRVRTRTRELELEVARGTEGRQHISTLLGRVVTAQEDERARIARDLHDHLGQQLTALRLTLERHREAAPAARKTEDLDRALQIAQTIDREVDFLAWELRPAALDHLGLAAALPRFVHEWSTHYGISAEFQGTQALAGRLSPTAEIAFYRVAQEALNNVVKHAKATRVDVLLENRDHSVVLIVEDDGVGFEASKGDTTDDGIGLAGMRERAALVGATLQVESEPGRGTTVFLRYPVPKPDESGPS